MAIIYIKTDGHTREFQISPQVSPQASTATSPSKTSETNESVIGIGRSEDNQLPISSSTVSNHHARIAYEQGEIVIYDLSSATGTFVNRQPINRHSLRLDDKILIGNQELVYAGLKAEFSDASTGPVMSETKTSDVVEIDIGNAIEIVATPDVSAPKLHSADEVDELDSVVEYSNERLDIVEPWAHLDAENEVSAANKKVVDIDAIDSSTRSTDTPSKSNLNSSKQKPSEHNYASQRNKQLKPTDSTEKTDSSAKSISESPAPSTIELEKDRVPLKVKKPRREATAKPMKKPLLKGKISTTKEALTPPRQQNISASKVVSDQSARRKSRHSDPKIKRTSRDVDRRVDKSVGRENMPMERPHRRAEPIKLDFELPDPLSATPTSSKRAPKQHRKGKFASTSPDLFVKTKNKAPRSAEKIPGSEAKTKPEARDKKPQTTMEMVSPVGEPQAEEVTPPKRDTMPDRVEPTALKLSHLLIQAGPNAGNRALLKHDRTILGINGHHYAAVTRVKDNFAAVSLDPSVTVSINGVPLETKPLSLNDGDFLEFFDVRLRFVA